MKMDKLEDTSTSWKDEEVSWHPATEPSIVSTLVTETPELTAAAVATVAVIVLLTIAAVFLLGLLIDCRQKKLLDKIGRVKKLKNQKRFKHNVTCAIDVSIAGNMEETATSAPPADALRNIL